MIGRELVVDLFCGGGGTSAGLKVAFGRDPDVAVNHDERAVSVHAVNHPETLHLHGDVWHYAPLDVTRGTPVGLLWASPTCTHFSQAKGGPLDFAEATKIRALAKIVVRWAETVAPRVIMIENVEQFEGWGPLRKEDGRPCKRRKGTHFRSWVRDLEKAGYKVEWRQLRACDYGAPTSRRRLFVIARRDGQPICWPEPSHGPAGSGLLPYRSAAECIDWSIPCPSIFGRKRPLAEPTLRRVARGIRKFVLESADPFVIPTRHAGDDRVHSIHEPLRTVTASNRGELALVAPTLVHVSNGERPGQAPRVYDIEKPLTTVVAKGIKHGLVTAFLAKHFGGHEGPGIDVRSPMSTVTCRDHHAVVTASAEGDRREEVRAFLSQYNGQSIGQALGLPMPTATTRDRFALVTVRGRRYEIADIGMRLLVPRELFNAQGFPADYVIERGARGEPITKTAQVKMGGNSVPPQLVVALVRANGVSESREVAA